MSRRYAYDLVDELPKEYAWIHDGQSLKQYGEAEMDKGEMPKSLAVDFEGVHGPPCPVNTFTTTISNEGAE